MPLPPEVATAPACTLFWRCCSHSRSAGCRNQAVDGLGASSSLTQTP